MNDGTVEDGRIVDCRICGVTTHMIDPEEMNEVCDACSIGGWGHVKKAYLLRRGDVIFRGGRQSVILQEEDWGKRRMLQVRDDDGKVGDLLLRSTDLVHVHMDRQEP
jgi:hypothetical protein